MSQNKKRNSKNYKKGNNRAFSKPVNNGKGKGDYNGKEACETKETSTRMEDIRSNDIGWWNRSPIFKDATSIQWNRFPGYIYDRSTSVYKAASGNLVADPAVARISYVPTIGVSTGYQSPVNRSFTSLFAEIVAKSNTANLGFTQSSLAMLAMASSSVVTLIAELKRAYGLKNLYINQNANYPRVLFAACGFGSYDDVNWEQMRVRLNTLIADFNSLNIPKYVSLYDRAFQLPYNMYADEDSVLANVYVFTPTVYYKYVDTENTAEAMLRNISSVDEGLDLLTELLVALRSTSDLGLIMGAYRRAFPESDTLKFEMVSHDHVTIPWFDRNMMWQINNMSIVRNVYLDTLDIIEDVEKDILLCQPAIPAEAPHTVGQDMFNITLRLDSQGGVTEFASIRLNSFDGDTTPEFVMEATRLQVVVGLDGYIRACGTEIVDSVSIYSLYIDSDNKLQIQRTYISPSLRMNETNYPIENTWADQLYAYTKFRNAWPFGTWSGYGGRCIDFRDYHITTSLEYDQIEQIHEAALQSCYLLNVPTRWN